MTSTTSERPAQASPSRSNAGFDAEAAFTAVERVLRAAPRPTSLHEPMFRGREWNYVKETLDSGWVSSAGSYVERFERDLASVCEVKHAVATVNGTAALHMCLHLAGVTAGDEVLAPALTFIATANAISYCGAIPHFCDVTERTLGLDPFLLDAHLRETAEVRGGACRNRKTGRRIAACIPMHAFGHPVELDELVEVCARWRVALVEDVAEALGSHYKGRHVGNCGLASALSFNGNKIVTSGGGGAILTNDPVIARHAKHLTTTAKQPHKWAFNHDVVGYNYRLPNLNAALGCAQLEQLPGFLSDKRALALRYVSEFSGVAGARIFADAPFAQSNYWLVTLLLDKADTDMRDAFLERCHAGKVLARPAWTCMHRLAPYAACPRMDLSGTENLEARIVNLPSSVIIERDYAA
jgi:perosamine synthetase